MGKDKEPDFGPEEKPKVSQKERAKEHIFTHNACDCGNSWPKELGSECPRCKPKGS